MDSLWAQAFKRYLKEVALAQGEVRNRKCCREGCCCRAWLWRPAPWQTQEGAAVEAISQHDPWTFQLGIWTLRQLRESTSWQRKWTESSWSLNPDLESKHASKANIWKMSLCSSLGDKPDLNWQEAIYNLCISSLEWTYTFCWRNTIFDYGMMSHNI